MEKKFILTDETEVWYGRTLHRIKALKNFSNVKAGDIGGWVEKEENLSQEGNCWVYDEAKVHNGAKVFDNARVYGNATVSDWARICDGAVVYGNACVYGGSMVYGDARVYGEAMIYGEARVSGCTRICGEAKIYDDARVSGNAEVYGDARVCGEAEIYTDIYGKVEVYGDAKVRGNAKVRKSDDILWITGIGSRYGTTTVCRDKNDGLLVSCGCFLGKLDEFLKKVKETHANNKFGREYKTLIELIKIHFYK